MNDPLNPLSQLKDIQLPDPVGWWPLAFSWWVLIFSVIVIFFSIIWFLLDRHKRTAYRREAEHKLQAINDNPQLDTQQQIVQINGLLKQVAITVYGRQKIAGLNEQAWLAFLKSTAQFIEQPDVLATLLNQVYQPQNALDEHELKRNLATWQGYARQWIKGHHL